MELESSLGTQSTHPYLLPGMSGSEVGRWEGGEATEANALITRETVVTTEPSGRLSSSEGLESRKWIRVRFEYLLSYYYVPSTELTAGKQERHTSLLLECTQGFPK